MPKRKGVLNGSEIGKAINEDESIHNFDPMYREIPTELSNDESNSSSQ